MFIELMYKVNGYNVPRYFKTWDNAKAELQGRLKGLTKDGYAIVTRKIDRMNTEKGFYEYQYDLTTTDGMKIVMALIEHHFDDI